MPKRILSGANLMRGFLMVVLLLSGVANSFAVGPYFSRTGTNTWTGTSSWLTGSCAGTNTALVPTSSDAVTICAATTITNAVAASGAALTVNGTLTLTAGTLTVSSLTLATGSTLNMNGGTLTVTGNVSYANGATIASNTTSTINVGGTWTGSGNAFNPGTTLTINYNGVTQTIPALNNPYYNLTITTAGTKTLGADVSVTNTTNIASGTLALSTFTLNVGGALTNSGTFTAGTGTVNFNANGAQSIPALSYYKLSTSTGGTKTLAGTITVSNALNVGASTTLDLTSSTLNLTGAVSSTVTGAITMTTGTLNASSSTGTIAVGASPASITVGAGNTAGSFLVTGALTVTTGSITVNGTATLNFNNAGAQTVPAPVTVNANGIMILSGSGVKTLSASNVINGKLSLQGTVTIGGSSPNYGGTGGTATLEYKGTWASTQAVTFNEWTQTVAQSPANVIVNCTNGITITSLNLTTATLTPTLGTIVVATGSTLTVTGTQTWANATISVASGTLNCQGIVNANGTTINIGNASGGTMDITGANGVLNLGGSVITINLSGTLQFTSTNAAAVGSYSSGSIKATSGTLSFSPASGSKTWTVPAGYIFATSPLVLANFTVAMGSAGSLTLNNTTASDITVATSYNLTSGLTVLAGSGSIQLQANCGFVGTPSATNMVTTPGTGYFKRQIPTYSGSTINRIYPIGEGAVGSGEYSGFTMQITANDLSNRVIGFRVTDANPNSISGISNYVSRYWTSFASATTGTFTYSMSLPYFTSGDINGLESKMSGAYKNGTTWTGIGSVDGTGHLIVYSGVTAIASLVTGNEFAAVEVGCPSPSGPQSFSISAISNTSAPVTMSGTVGFASTTNVTGIIIFANTSNINASPADLTNYNVGDVLPSGSIVVFKGGTVGTSIPWSYDASLTGGTDLSPNTFYYFNIYSYSAGTTCNTKYSGTWNFSSMMPNITQSSIPTVATCAGAQTVNISYTSSGAPDQYNVVWDAGAVSAGFANVPAGATYSGGFSNLPITITVPAGVAPGTYTAKVNPKNSSNGFDNLNYNGGGSANLPGITINVVANTGISGTKTVGTGGDYPTFNGAGGLFAAINANGLVGDLTVNVISDITETTTTGLNQVGNYCGGPYNITIQSSAATVRTISGSLATPLIQFSGADNVVIDGNVGGSGRYLTFKNTNTGAGSVFNFTSDASNITIKNCDIQGLSSTTTSAVINLGAGTSTGNSSITLNNNLIHDAGTGQYPLYLIYSSGNGSAPNNTISITNNELYNFSSFGGGTGGRRAYAMNVTATGNGSNWTITGNSIYNTFIDGTGFQSAISFIAGAASTGNAINSNYIGGRSASGGVANTPWQNSYNPSGTECRGEGIVVNAGSVTLDANNITNIYWSGGDYTGFACVNILGSTVATITNNNFGTGASGQPNNTKIIQVAGGGVSLGTGPGYIYGIWNQSTTTSMTTYDGNSFYYLFQAGGCGSCQGGNVQCILHQTAGPATITNNVINGPQGAGYGWNQFGIRLEPTASTSGNLIEHNVIAGPYVNGSGVGNGVTNSGIYVKVLGTSTVSGTIKRNVVWDMRSNEVEGFTEGIYVWSSTGGNGNWDIYNNQVTLKNNGNTGVPVGLYGIDIELNSASTTNVSYNSVYISGSNGGTPVNGYDFSSYAFFRYPNASGTVTGDAVTLTNNIFVNWRLVSNGVTTGHFAIANLGSAAATNWSASDKNFLAVANGSKSFLGYWVNATKLALSNWKTASGKDANSYTATYTSGASSFGSGTLNADNLFSNPLSDLHISLSDQESYKFVDARASVISTTTDFDGDNRDGSTPDIGADEFTATGITTTPATFGPFCNNTANNISVGYTTTGTLTGTYYVQISDASGNFTATTTGPTIIGTGTGSSPISATIPSGITAGTGYKVRVINTNPVTYGSDNGTAFAINAPPATPTFTTATATNNNLTPCQVSNTYTINTQTGYTYSWSVPGGWGAVSGGTTAQITVTPGLASGNVTASVSIAGCATSSASLSVAPIAPAATPVANGNVTPQTSNVNQNDFIANWGTASGATGYYIDVATTSSFLGSPTPIASDGFEGSLSLFTQTASSGSAAAFYNSTSGASDGPASSPFSTGGTSGYGISNGSVTITSTAINTAAYNSAQMSFRLASFSLGSAGNGADAGDIVTVEVSADGTNYFSTVRVLGNSNAYWAYAATGNASTGYDGNATPVDFAPASGGNRTSDGYSTVTVTGLPISSTMKVRITLLNNSANERWVIDDVSVTGIGSSAIAGYNNLLVPSGTTQSVTGLSAGTTYYYRVRATNACGTSGNSNVVAVTTTLPATPAIAVTGQAHNSTYAYNNHPVNSNTDHTFTITNSGTADLNIISVVVGGSGFSLQGTAPTTVASGGGSATFTVRFTPNAATSFTGTVTINSDATLNAYVINLTGSGDAASASVIQAVSGSEANTISSLSNGTIANNTQGTQVWQFKLFDGDGTNSDGDGLPTVYTQFTIRAATGNTVPNWATVIDNVKFFKGSSSTPIAGSFIVSNSTISFTPSSGISVAQGAGSFEQISMRLTVDNPMAAGSDGQFLVFKLDNTDVTVGSAATSSQLATFTPSSNTSKNQIDVQATLQFINAPAAVILNSTFSVTVSAVDANGNVDQNETAAITLAQSSGAGTMSGGSTHNLVNGTFTYTGLSYNLVGTFQVTASGGSFAPISATIICTNDPYQAFDDFNRTDNTTVGIPSSGGVVAWAETGGATVRQRIQGNQLVLSNGDAACASSGAGYEQVVFDGSSKYSTVFNNANGPLNWVFNMRSSRSTPSGFSSGNTTYGLAVVLGCNQSDFTSATANGYAVVLGNAGSPDPLKLVYFTGGLTSNSNVFDIATSSYTGETDYLSVKVTFNRCNGSWSLYVRNDGAAFASPITGSLGSAFTATNSTYTASDLKYFGMAWQHVNSCEEKATFDNLYIPNALVATSNTKTWNGSVAGGDWNEPNNWGPCPGIPTATDNVIIPVTGNNPVVSATPAGICKDLTVAANAGLTINTGQFLNVRGNVVNNGVATFGAGTLSIEGSGSATVTGTITVGNVDISKNVTLNSGSAFNIQTSLDLQSGNLTNNGTITLKSDASGTAYLNNFGSYTGTYTGNLTVERYVAGVTGAHNISFPFTSYSLTNTEFTSQMGALGSSGAVVPLAGCNANNVASNSPYSKIFQWNENTNFTMNCSQMGWFARSSGVTEAGRGYSATLSNGQTLSVTGAPNLNTMGYAVTNSGYAPVSNPSPAATGFNPTYITTSAGLILTGNPFPSPYKWDGGDGVGGAIADVAYKWISTGTYKGSYQPIAVNDVLAIGQGFFIATSANTTLNYQNSNRVATTTPTFYQTNNGSNLDITVTGNGYGDRTQITFNDQSTTGFDPVYDGFKMLSNYNQPTLYTVVSGNKMACINTLPSIDESPNVVMGMFVGTNGTYEFTFNNINSFDPTTYITLEDLKTGIVQDMRANNTYTFVADTSDLVDRFVVHFTPGAEITTADQNCSTLGAISITQPGTAVWTYTITDYNNATISGGTLNNSNSVLVNAAAGTYTLTLVDANNYTVVKNLIVAGTQPVAAAFTPSVTAVETNVDVAFNSSTGNATDYYWDFGDGATGTGKNAIHSYGDTGTYTVTLIVMSASGCTSTDEQTITVTKTTTGLSSIVYRQSSISIWSNENRVYVDFSRQAKVEAEIEIYNILGQELVNEKFGRSTIYSKPIANIEAAYVIVKVKNEGMITTKRVFIGK